MKIHLLLLYGLLAASLFVGWQLRNKQSGSDTIEMAPFVPSPPARFDPSPLQQSEWLLHHAERLYQSDNPSPRIEPNWPNPPQTPPRLPALERELDLIPEESPTNRGLYVPPASVGI